MRALLLAIACGGCVISAPEGASQVWPPSLGLTVDAVVAADLDTNGSTELVVFGSGSPSQTGMYYLEGGTDLVYGSGNPVRSFSRFEPKTLTSPLATNYVAETARIYVAHSEGNLEITTLSNTLKEVATGASTLPAGGALLWTRLVTFPGGMEHVAVSNGSGIDHLTIDLSDPRPIPADMSPTWSLAQLITSYSVTIPPAPTEQWIAVATPDQIRRAKIPVPGQMFVWEKVRGATPAPAWVGQTAFDFDDDGRDEIVGFDLAAHDVCVIDPGAPLGTMPSCRHLDSTFAGNEVTLLIGQDVSMMPGGPDILVAQTNATETRYSLIENYEYSAGMLMGTPRDIPVTGPPRGRTVIVNGGPGTPNIALTFATDGTAVCALGPC